MALNINNQEAQRLVRALVAETGETVTDAVMIAVQERLTRIHSGDPESRLRRIHAIASDASDRWQDRYADVDHAGMLYDEKGLPC